MKNPTTPDRQNYTSRSQSEPRAKVSARVSDADNNSVFEGLACRSGEPHCLLLARFDAGRSRSKRCCWRERSFESCQAGKSTETGEFGRVLVAQQTTDLVL